LMLGLSPAEFGVAFRAATKLVGVGFSKQHRHARVDDVFLLTATICGRRQA
jgi:hypothetical protein